MSGATTETKINLSGTTGAGTDAGMRGAAHDGLTGMRGAARRRIAVKVGSNVLTRANGSLDFTRMSALADQIVELRARGFAVVLVSSGAVTAGRNALRLSAAETAALGEVGSRQLFSAVGQAKLMNRYVELFQDDGIVCGQILTTKEHFSTPEHCENQKRCLEVMLANDVVPVVNENDTISIAELMFTDNDELSGLIARLVGAELLVILSNVDGIFTGTDGVAGTAAGTAVSEARLIREVRAGDAVESFISAGKSAFGRGGMVSKCKVAREVAAAGIPVVIANGRRENILLKIFDDPAGTPCTRFLAGE